MTSVASSLPSLDNYPSAFSSFHSSLPSLPPSHYSTAFSSKAGGVGGYGGQLLTAGGGGSEGIIDDTPRINGNDFNDPLHNSSTNGGGIGVGDNDNYNYYQGYENSQNAVTGDLVSDILLNDPLKSSYTSINLNFDNNEAGVFDGHFLSNFSSSSIGNGVPSNASLAQPALNQFTNNHSAFSARISLNNGAMINNGPLLATNDGDDYHHNAEDLERLQIDLERLNVTNTNPSSFNQSPSLTTLPSLSNLSSATTNGFSSYWSSGYSSSPPSAIAPIDAFYNPSIIDSKKSLQLQQSLQGVHINGVSLNANAPAFSPTHGGGGQEGGNTMNLISFQRSQTEGGPMHQQLLLQQQQNQLQRSQLQNALTPLSSSAPAAAPNATTNAPSQSSPPPSAPANGSSSPSSSASSATVSLSSVAGGLNPSTLLASAESPHALSLLETLLGVSPLASLLTMEDIDKSVQLRCVLLELDRAYKEIVHLKQENMNLQKNIDKCIKVMNLQDVDQYVNSLARIYSNGPQGANQQERAQKHNNYNKYSSHGQHHNNQFNAAANNGENTANESETGSDHPLPRSSSETLVHGGGKRVYYGPSSGNFRGGRGGGGYRGGRGGQRGYSNAPH